MTPEQIAEKIWKEHGTSEPFTPHVFYDADGDCVEFFAENEAFIGERLDKWVTVYRGRNSGRIVGSLIKNIKQLLSKMPGLAVDIRSGPVRFAHLLVLQKGIAGSELTVSVYREIIESAETHALEADLQEAAC